MLSVMFLLLFYYVGIATVVIAAVLLSQAVAVVANVLLSGAANRCEVHKH